MVNKNIYSIKRSLADELLQHPGISGVGIGLTDDGSKYIQVYLQEDSPEVRETVPDSVEGYDVRVETIGAIRALHVE